MSKFTKIRSIRVYLRQNSVKTFQNVSKYRRIVSKYHQLISKNIFAKKNTNIKKMKLQKIKFSPPIIVTPDKSSCRSGRRPLRGVQWGGSPPASWAPPLIPTAAKAKPNLGIIAPGLCALAVGQKHQRSGRIVKNVVKAGTLRARRGAET